MKTHEVVQTPIEALRPAAANARVHSKKQIKQIARSIQRYGFNAPVLVGDDGEIIDGHGRVEAAKLLGLEPSRLSAWHTSMRSRAVPI